MEKLIPLVGVILVVAGVAYVAWLHYGAWQMSKRGDNLIKMLKEEDPVPNFYVNKVKDVLAVCTAEAFHAALTEYELGVKEGRILPTAKVVVRPSVTFTFARNEESRRPIHTGTRSELETLAHAIFYWQTKVAKKDLEPSDYIEALKFFFREDERLFVPYAVDDDKVLAEQLKHYGHKTMDDLWAIVREWLASI